MRSLEEDLAAAIAYHGHLCSGMILGVRMARLGIRILGIDDPLSFRDLIVYVEMDRCASDAVSVVSDCTVGRRKLKIIDYGKMGATFVDLANNQAVRVALKMAAFPKPGEDPVAFWRGFKDEEVFAWQKVRLNIPPEDLPGRPLNNVQCAQCGETVLDRREIIQSGRILCRACAGKPYYEYVQAGEVKEHVGNL